MGNPVMRKNSKQHNARRASKGLNNPSFIGDSTEKLPPAPSKDKTQFVIELTEKGKLAKEAEYDPYLHREVTHPTTNSETLFHLLKGSLGTGILAMPHAFKNSGYVTGTVCTILIGILCTYCIHLIIKAEYELCKRKKIPSMGYPEVAQAAFSEGPGFFKAMARHIPHVVNTFLLIYQLGTCCVYVVFVALNIQSIVDHYLQRETDPRLYMLMILLPLILINWVRNLKYLAPFSTFANFITLVSFGIILYYIFRKPIDISDKVAFGTIHDFPLFFGTVLFALEAIGVIMPLENEMKTPKSFGGYCGVLNTAMITIITLYVGMGLFGYLNYGDHVEPSITLNLETSEILGQCAKGMLAFAIFITHGLACYVAIDLTWTNYIAHRMKPDSKTVFWQYVVRTLLVLITFLLAVAIPNLDLFISLFGALCLSALGLAFPACIEMCTYWYSTNGAAKVWLITKNVIIVTIGVIGLCVGTYTSISEIIKKFIK